MTNQESIECTCIVGRDSAGERIIHGPCHSPGPEVWADLIQAGHTLCWFWETYHSCACGARTKSLNTHPHVPGCPTAKALARKEKVMKLETTPEERLYWPHHPDAQADVARAARDISTLLARNEELEQALREVWEARVDKQVPEGYFTDETEAVLRTLINGEEK